MRNHGEMHAVRHPSGWWKASDGEWYPPEDEPQASRDSNDLYLAMSLAIAAIVLGSFLPWTRQLFTTVHGTDGNGVGNLTLLLAGTAGALFARWHVDGRAHHGLLSASLVLCSAANAVVLYHLANATGELQGGVFLTAVGALMATVLCAVARQRTRLSAA